MFKLLRLIKDKIYCWRTGQVRTGDINARGRVYQRKEGNRDISRVPFGSPARVKPKITVQMQVIRRDGTREPVITVPGEALGIKPPT